MKNVLCEGESFDKNEIDEAIKTIYDPDYDVINYDVWTNKLLVNNFGYNLPLGKYWPIFVFSILHIHISKNTFTLNFF